MWLWIWVSFRLAISPSCFSRSLLQLSAKRGVIVGSTKGLFSFRISSTNVSVPSTDSSVVSLHKEFLYWIIAHLYLLHWDSHIKVGAVAIGTDLAYQCSLTLTCRLISQDKCGPQVVGSEIWGESGAATDGSFLKRERERVSSYQLGQQVYITCVYVWEIVSHYQQMLCVCACRQYTGGYVTDKHSKLCSLELEPHILTTTPL